MLAVVVSRRTRVAGIASSDEADYPCKWGPAFLGKWKWAFWRVCNKTAADIRCIPWCTPHIADIVKRPVDSLHNPS